MSEEKTPHAELVTITPELATEWLTRNTRNRNLYRRKVAYYKGIIERGEWVLNGETIKWSVDMVLIDGQHRLEAIVESGITVQSFVVWDLSAEAQATIDDVQRRRLADQLKLPPHELPSAGAVAATVNMKWKIDNDCVRTANLPSTSQGMALYLSHPSLADAVKVGMRWHKRLSGSNAAISALYYEFSQLDEDAAEVFFESIIEGTGLTPGMPMFALRRQVETQRPGAVMLLALTIKAWNAYKEGRSVDKLVWRPVGKHAEVFPRILGKEDYAVEE